jgi:uncharacterized membrane protein
VRKVSNIIGIIIGVVLLVLGFILMVTWWSVFIKAVMAIIPILLILMAAGALAYFISEIKSKLEVAEEKGNDPGDKESEEK